MPLCEKATIQTCGRRGSLTRRQRGARKI